MSEEPRRARGVVIVAALAGTAAVTALALGVGRALRTGDVVERTEDEPPHGDVPCADGLEPIAAGGCFRAAAGPADGAPELLVYLHGLFDPPHEREELDRQARVARAASAKGFAVLALRGKLGACSTNERYDGWWCWPSNERTADGAPAFVASWGPALAAAEKRAGQGRRVVLGFSNGAYFASLLAVRGYFDAQAYVIAHGGPVEPVKARGKRVPMLLLSADDDYAQQEMVRLEDELRADKWPVEIAARAGGHALTDEDIGVALAFFARARRETPPLHPPLSTHAPRWRDAPRAALDAQAPAPAAERADDAGAPAERAEEQADDAGE